MRDHPGRSEYHCWRLVHWESNNGVPFREDGVLINKKQHIPTYETVLNTVYAVEPEVSCSIV